MAKKTTVKELEVSGRLRRYTAPRLRNANR